MSIKQWKTTAVSRRQTSTANSCVYTVVIFSSLLMIDGLFLYHNGAHSVKLLWKDFHHLFPETLLFTFFRSSSKRFWSSRQDPEARQINQQKFQVSNVPPWQLSQVRSSSVFGFLFWYCSKGIAWIASDWLKRSNLLALLNKKPMRTARSGRFQMQHCVRWRQMQGWKLFATCRRGHTLDFSLSSREMSRITRPVWFCIVLESKPDFVIISCWSSSFLWSGVLVPR